MLKPRKSTTAPAIILLFWTLALVLLADVASGLRVGTAFGVGASFGLGNGPGAPPRQAILSLHLATCLLLVTASFLFLQRSRLEANPVREVRAGRSWRRINGLVLQSFFALVALQALCALLLAAGGGIGIARLHFATTALMIAAVPTHVVLQFLIGGRDHGLRMLRPRVEPARPAPLGRGDVRPQRLRRVLQSTRLFSLVLGVVFGATAATAFVGSLQVRMPASSPGPSSRLALPDPSVQFAWDPPLGLLR